jgi:PAS domain-containing protein
MTTNGTSIGEWAETLHGQKPYYLVIIDFEGCMSFANVHFYRGLQSAVSPQPTVTGTDFFQLVHEMDRQQLNKTLATCSLRDEAVSTEFRIRNGQYQWVRWEISRICKPEIMAEKFLCLGYDIAAADQQKKNMQAFEQYYLPDNALFQSFMAHTPGFSWIVDEEDNLMFANTLFLEYFGLEATVFGKGLGDILPPVIAGSLRGKHRLVCESGIPDHSSISLPANSGKEGVYQLTIFPIRSSSPGIMIGGQAYGLHFCSSISTLANDIQYNR